MLRKFRDFARRHRATYPIAIGAASLLLLAVFTLLVVVTDPGAAARGAEVLRGVIGQESVARLETWVLGWQDTLQALVYHASGEQPQAPWAGPTPALTPDTRIADVSPTASPAPAGTQAGALPTPPGTPTHALEPGLPTATGSPANLPAPLKPMGHASGEGAWSVYFKDRSGQAIAFRTYLDPDPQRAYAVAAVVAINLSAIRLHFMLGTLEPASVNVVNRPGRIPLAALRSGLVLAAFNGGFKAEHGQFGAMANGVVVVPPRQSFGTVAMFDDGRVAIGEWGSEVFYATGLRNWRQNGPLIVHNGRVNPHTADASPQDWGYTVAGGTATWRSGLGLSADGHTLYYVAGEYLTLPVLAAAMANTGAANGVQLDINGYWVKFDAIKYMASGYQTEPLMVGMKTDDRYLHPFDRDFFYLTANAN